MEFTLVDVITRTDANVEGDLIDFQGYQKYFPKATLWKKIPIILTK